MKQVHVKVSFYRFHLFNFWFHFKNPNVTAFISDTSFNPVRIKKKISILNYPVRMQSVCIFKHIKRKTYIIFHREEYHLNKPRSWERKIKIFLYFQFRHFRIIKPWRGKKAFKTIEEGLFRSTKLKVLVSSCGSLLHAHCLFSCVAWLMTTPIEKKAQEIPLGQLNFSLL